LIDTYSKTEIVSQAKETLCNSLMISQYISYGCPFEPISSIFLDQLYFLSFVFLKSVIQDEQAMQKKTLPISQRSTKRGQCGIFCKTFAN